MNKFLACTSISACVGGFVTQALPYLQFIALVISIVAGVAAIVRKPRGGRWS